MLRRLAALLFIVIFAGCGGGSAPKPQSYPQWYLNPPQSNGATLYGVGSGPDLPSAKNEALSAISANLSVTVQSQFKKSDHSIRTNNSEQTLQDVLNTVQADTKALTFSNVNVEQNSVLNDKVLILVSVDRAQLFNDQKHRLDTKTSALKTELKNAEALSSIERFIIFKKVRAEHVGIASGAELLAAIKPGFDNSAYLDFTAANDSQFDSLKHGMKLHIKSDADTKLFVAPVIDALTEEGIKVEQSQSSGKSVVIELAASTQQDTLYGYKIEKLRLSATTKTASGKTVASKQHTFSGKSRYDYTQARHQSVAKFKKKIAQDGIFTVLGL